MLSCRDLANTLASDYVDGHLGLRARLGVRLHLALCENCRRFMTQLRRVRRVVKQHAPAPSPAEDNAALRDLATQLHAIAHTEKQKKNSS